MKTERDKRSIAFFTYGYKLEEEGKIDEAIEAFEKSVEYIDTEMRSTAAFLHLYDLYREKGDKDNMRRVLNQGIEYANYFNEKVANELIEQYPEHKEGILEALETNEPYPNDWLEKGINPLFRPYDSMFMIDLLTYMDEEDERERQKKFSDKANLLFENMISKYDAKGRLGKEDCWQSYNEVMYGFEVMVERIIRYKNGEIYSDEQIETYLCFYKWLIEALLSLNASDTDLNRVVKFISHNNPINLPSVESIKKEYDDKMEERRKAEEPIIVKVSINVNET